MFSTKQPYALQGLPIRFSVKKAGTFLGTAGARQATR